MSISDGGQAEPDRRRRWTLIGGKLPRALIAQPAMGSPLIVLLAIVFHDHSRFRQCPQLFPVQTFTPETTVKAFHKTVLPRTTGVNVERFVPIGDLRRAILANVYKGFLNFRDFDFS